MSDPLPPGDAPAPQKKSSSAGRAVGIALAVLALIAGLSLILYPTVADFINDRKSGGAIDDYSRHVASLPEGERASMVGEAARWNADLLATGTKIGELPPDLADRYDALLDPTGTGVMGYLEIEAVGVTLPIYHGTDESVLSSGIGHLKGSSLPVGGEGTHAILSGHSGLPSAKLLTNLDELEEGDTFIVRTMGEVLTYRVISRKVMLPERAEVQEIDPARDLCTLITCTPYGVNSHRLVVTGERTANAPEEDTSRPSLGKVLRRISPTHPWLPPVAIILAAALLGGAIAAVILHRRRKKRKNSA